MTDSHILDRPLRWIARQRWLRLGIRDRIVRRFSPPDRVHSRPFESALGGLRYRGDLKSFIDWSIFYYGAYSREELELLRVLLGDKQNKVFVDVGANVGQHSLFASQYAREVHAFEPFPIVADQFAENVRLNNLKNISIHRVGLGNQDATLAYAPPESENLGTGTFCSVSAQHNCIPLAVRRGDSFLNGLGLSAIDVIKIDTEGFEVQVLEGLAETLNSFRPMVFFEWTIERHTDHTIHPLDLFPSGYGLRSFHSEQVFALAFNTPGFNLRKASEIGPGNYLAGPEEQLSRL